MPLAFQEYDHVVHKIQIELGDFAAPTPFKKVSIELPRGAEIIHVDNQKEIATFWYNRAVGDIPFVKRNIYMFATGQVISKNLQRMYYVGTVLFKGGDIVCHFYSGYEEGTTFGV